jgi:hypothetical protein
MNDMLAFGILSGWLLGGVMVVGLLAWWGSGHPR